MVPKVWNRLERSGSLFFCVCVIGFSGFWCLYRVDRVSGVIGFRYVHIYIGFIGLIGFRFLRVQTLHPIEPTELRFAFKSWVPLLAPLYTTPPLCSPHQKRLFRDT